MTQRPGTAGSPADTAAAPVIRQRGRPSTGVRDAVLGATATILREDGIARLSTKEVARRAGVAESSIFYHFGDKHELLQAVVRMQTPTLDEVSAQLRERVGSGSIRNSLLAMCDALEEFYAQVLPVLSAIQADGELRRRLRETGAEDLQGALLAIERITGYLRLEVAAGRLRPGVDAHAAAVLLVGASYQRALHTHMSGVDATLPPVDTVVDTLLPALVPN